MRRITKVSLAGALSTAQTVSERCPHFIVLVMDKPRQRSFVAIRTAVSSSVELDGWKAVAKYVGGKRFKLDNERGKEHA